MTAENPSPLNLRLYPTPTPAADGVQRTITARQPARRERCFGELNRGSKTFEAEAMYLPVIAAVQRAFGEPRAGRQKTNWPALIRRTPALSLHLLGPLQSNKAERGGRIVRRILRWTAEQFCKH